MPLALARDLPEASVRPEWVERWTGMRIVASGREWIVPDDDPQLLAGPRPTLVAGPEYKLEARLYDEIADRVATDFLDDELESRHSPPNRPIGVKGGYGLRGDLERAQLEYFFASRARLRKVGVKQLLAYMRETFPVSHVLPVRLASGYQQAILSLAKIPLLISRLGIDQTRKALDKSRGESGPWDSILPKATDVSAYLDGLVFANPLALALPIHRTGSALYFAGTHIQILPRLATENLIGQLSMQSAPVVDDQENAFNKLTAFFHHIPPRPYLAASVAAINSIMRTLNDPRTFAANGLFDGEAMLRTQCLVRLMFSDLLAANETGSRYSRDRLAFGFVDKVANLIYGFDRARSETDSFRLLFRRQTGADFAAAIRRFFGANNRRLGRDMERFVNRVYEDIHAHLSLQLGISSSDEAQLLDRVWALRGTNHGAFLKGSKFEDLFHKAGTTVPTGVQFVPLIVTWAMASDFNLVARLRGPA